MCYCFLLFVCKNDESNLSLMLTIYWCIRAGRLSAQGGPCYNAMTSLYKGDCRFVSSSTLSGRRLVFMY